MATALAVGLLGGTASAARLPTASQAAGLRAAFKADRSHPQNAVITFVLASKVNSRWGDVGYVVPPKRSPDSPALLAAKPKSINVRTYEHTGHRWTPAKPPPKLAKDLAAGDTLEVVFTGTGHETGDSTTTSGCPDAGNGEEITKYHLNDSFTWNEIWTYNPAKPGYGQADFIQYLVHTAPASSGTYDKSATFEDDSSACAQGTDVSWSCTAQDTIFKGSWSITFLRKAGNISLAALPAFLESKPPACTKGNHSNISNRVDNYAYSDLWVSVPFGGGKELVLDDNGLGPYTLEFPHDLYKSSDVHEVTSHHTGFCRPDSTDCSDTLEWAGTIEIKDKGAR